tara:strand:- start:3 stop:308 length:306 start_codon:yes stop_codon:yes gene_type:complete
MRLAIILVALTFLSACTERQVFQMRWIEDLTFFIEMRTEPQELKQIAIETLKEEAQEVCDQFSMTAVMYQVAQERQRTSIFDTKISGGKVRGTFRCESAET